MAYFYMYILECSDGSYYVGHTYDLNKRISQHMLKLYEGYTAARLPVTLVGAQTFYTRDEAFAAERKVKKWARAKKEAFIKSNWNELSNLAKKVFKGPHECSRYNFSQELEITRDERKQIISN